MKPQTWSRVPVAGTLVRLLAAGPQDSEEAVVFVHGNPGSADDWARLVPAAAEHARALAFDLPDFGQTEAAPGFSHSVEGYAGALGQTLEALGVQRAHLVLHDFGGPIGLAWAAAHPQALRSVTLIDTGVLPGYTWHRLARIWRTPVLGELFQATATRPAFRYLINRSEPRGLPREFVDRMYDHFDRRTRRAVLKLYRATDDPGGPPGLIDQFKQLDLPALVIWGRGDSYLPVSYAKRQRDAFPSAHVRVLEDSGHWPQADAPDAVEQLLVSFLDEVQAPVV